MNDSAGGNGRRVARTVAVMGALACTASLLLAHVHPFGDAGLYGARNAKTQLLATSSLPPDVRATLTESLDRVEGADLQSFSSGFLAHGARHPQRPTGYESVVVGSLLVPKAQERLDLVEYLKANTNK
jgi:hypothetical protein